MNKKLLFGFFAHGLQFNGNTLKEKSLGGSETALLYMARELAARGHDVKVFNNCDKPDRYDGVDYFDYKTSWKEIAPLCAWDVFIASRDYTFLSQKLNAKMTILWNHDIATDRKNMLINSWGIDLTWCLSKFHVEQYLSVAKELEPIMNQTRNGVDLQLIDSIRNIAGERNKKQFIWGSRPERGLDNLLINVWPKILKEVDSTARLLIAGYDDKGINIPEEVQKFHEYIEKLIIATPNVFKVGNLTKEEWYKLLSTSGMMIYPTNFPEISCINAMEAQACELPIVTTNSFALVETIGDKANLINNHPKSDEYHTQFVNRVKKLYTNSHEYSNSQKKGYTHIAGRYEWNIIAKEWEDLIWDRFESRSLKNGGRNVLKRFVYNSDLLAARWAIENVDKTHINKIDCATTIKEVDRSLDTHHENPEDYSEGERVSDTGWDRNARFGLAIGMIKEHFEEKSFSLLDIGCGSGGFLARALKECPGQVEVMGMDFSQGLLDKAEEILVKNFKDIKNPKEFLINKDFMLADIPKPDELADCIFAGEWLEHQNDVYGALTKLEKFVKKDGRIVITIPNGPWEAITYHEHIQRFHVSHFEFRDIEELFNPKEFSMQFLPIGVSPIDGSLLGNWIIIFKADSSIPFGQIDYLRKFLTARPYQSISACMIVKNEEDNITKCLKSISMQVDEIVVADTGSVDDTVKLSEKYATKVVSIPWPEDFSEARNTSVSLADPDADWIYWMDADEILVGQDKLRKYLNSEIFNGYVITQNHLVLDMPNVKPDVPVRIYRNNIGIKFYGAIHEHCEKKMDVPIEPVLILPDVKIIHYGYLTEQIRRDKCKNRNLALLKKDREKYPNRVLGIVLMMRDYLNISQWELEESGGTYTDKIVLLLQETVRLYNQYFTDPENLYHELAYALYQRALSALGRETIPGIPDTGFIPFEVAFALGASVGGLKSPESIQPSPYWFLDRDEFASFISGKVDVLSNALKLPEVKKRKK